MKKSTLAQMLAYYAEQKEKHYLVYVNANVIPTVTMEENIDIIVCHAASAACTKIIKGKIVLGKEYIVSRGEELGFGLEPDAVGEYSSHWPWDYCYFYKL